MTIASKSTGRAVRFWHLADLHLSPCRKPQGSACDSCIKARVVSRLQERLEKSRTPPDLLLLAGDLTDLWTTAAEQTEAAVPLDRLVRAAIKKGVVVVGVTGEHDKVSSTATLRKNLNWTWLLRSGEVNRESGVAVYGVEGRPKQAGAKADIRAIHPKVGERSVLLAHIDWNTFPRDVFGRFNYCALGHLHWTKFRGFPDSSSVIAYPGHLFSYWDGCGKAWPVNILEGAIHPDGRVDVKRLPLSREAGAPETRRIYAAASEQGKSRGMLVFENAPSEAFFRKLGVTARIEADHDDTFETDYRQTARVRYGSKSQMRDIIRRTLDGHPNDVFVCPATARGQVNRIYDYGRTLTGDRFEEFITKTYKKSDNTQ